MTYQDTGFDTIFRDTANGQFDTAAAASTITPERQQKVNFTDPYYEAQQALVRRDAGAGGGADRHRCTSGLSAPAVTRTRELRSDLNAQMAESIGGMAVLQASNAAARFGERFAGINEAHYQSRQRELRANAWLLRPVLDLLNVLLLAVVICVFGTRGKAARMSALEVGVLYAFINYIARVVEPLIQITMQFSQLQQAMVGAARVHALLKEAETPVAADRRPRDRRRRSASTTSTSPTSRAAPCCTT